MQIIKPFVALIVISLSVYSCNSGTGSADSKKQNSLMGTGAVENSERNLPLIFDKLLGTWGNAKDKNFERWTKNEDGTFRSVVFHLDKKTRDTIWEEQANIFPEKDKWIYLNKVENQNQGQSIAFTSVLITDEIIQFSNPSHDFPTDIHYQVNSHDSLSAYIVGPNTKGGKDTIPFNYHRIQ